MKLIIEGENMPVSLFTAGYEDRDITEFIERLQKYGVRVLVDVRAIPASRKSGFSKRKLEEHLGSVGIQYMHAKELGSPKELRDKLRQDNDYDYFFTEYSTYLDSQEDTVKDLYEEIVTRKASCIMCMERLPTKCHRKIVAEKIKKIDGNGLKIVHI